MHYSLKNKKYLILSISAIILIWQGVAVSFNNRLLLPSFWDVLIEIYKIIKNKEFFKLIFSSSFRCIQSFILSIIIPIILSIYYSYTSDFQPQGRYIMGIIIPFTYFIVNGIQKILEKFVKSEKIRKCIVLVIMLLIIVISMRALFGYIIPRYK